MSKTWLRMALAISIGVTVLFEICDAAFRDVSELLEETGVSLFVILVHLREQFHAVSQSFDSFVYSL